ncbi:uncharacterized protein LOC114334815 [Diabrotica virgifera virgifera]|uniref:Uncharacterized protein LOC114334815 n=1 Tax=Diabrotica virgifera virgifera TaxID=50390 RepID=A0A6P7FW13_DIAVI|nr:uncharacterized protein LOC114334815 [Diabrotica virgifera virgifera]
MRPVILILAMLSILTISKISAEEDRKRPDWCPEMPSTTREDVDFFVNRTLPFLYTWTGLMDPNECPEDHIGLATAIRLALIKYNEEQYGPPRVVQMRLGSSNTRYSNFYHFLEFLGPIILTQIPNLTIRKCIPHDYPISHQIMHVHPCL